MCIFVEEDDVRVHRSFAFVVGFSRNEDVGAGCPAFVEALDETVIADELLDRRNVWKDENRQTVALADGRVLHPTNEPHGLIEPLETVREVSELLWISRPRR